MAGSWVHAGRGTAQLLDVLFKLLDSRFGSLQLESCGHESSCHVTHKGLNRNQFLRFVAVPCERCVGKFLVLLERLSLLVVELEKDKGFIAFPVGEPGVVPSTGAGDPILHGARCR